MMAASICAFERFPMAMVVRAQGVGGVELPRHFSCC